MSIFKNNFVVGVTAALVATVLAPIAVPAIKRCSRPLTKFLIKGGIVLYENAREAVAHAGEMMEDVVAEVRAESMERHSRAAGEETFPTPEGPSGEGAAGMPPAPVERGGAT